MKLLRRFQRRFANILRRVASSDRSDRDEVSGEYMLISSKALSSSDNDGGGSSTASEDGQDESFDECDHGCDHEVIDFAEMNSLGGGEDDEIDDEEMAIMEYDDM